MTKKNAVSVNQLTKIYAKNSTNSVVALNELNLGGERRRNIWSSWS